MHNLRLKLIKENITIPNNEQAAETKKTIPELMSSVALYVAKVTKLQDMAASTSISWKDPITVP